MAAKKSKPAAKPQKKPAAKPRRRTLARPDWAERFLAALHRGNITAACKAANVGRRTVYDRRDRDLAFAQAMADALEDAVDLLEAEAWRRAADGLERKRFHKGEPLIDPETGEQYVEREYSDQLMMQLLRAHRPERYRERREVEHTGGVRLELVEEIISVDGGDQGPV